MTEPNDLKGELDRLLNSGASELEFGDMCREFIGRHGARLKRALEDAEKWSAVEDIFGALGPYRYLAQTIKGRGTRCIWANPPPAGTKVLVNRGEGEKLECAVTSIQMAGMVGYWVKTEDDNHEECAFPSDLEYIADTARASEQTP